jgi:hypothetical protein
VPLNPETEPMKLHGAGAANAAFMTLNNPATAAKAYSLIKAPMRIADN